MHPLTSLKFASSNEYDFIIVGGGTAGSVIASRLTEIPTTKVLLLERGALLNTWSSRVPLLSSDFTGPSAPAYKWKSSPIHSLGGKSVDMVAGKALGGSSAINALLYTRSFPAEYDAWASDGRVGWSWKEVEPYFMKSESYLSQKSASRGHQGPWKVQCTDPVNFNIVKENIEAAAHFGFPFVSVANDPSAPIFSCTRLDATIDTKNHRSSTFQAFIPSQLANDRKANLHICTGALVRAIDIQDTADGPKAVGVTVENEAGGNDRYHISALREVIVCAGAIGSPQLLLLSGIGPAKDLNSLGIPLVVDLPGVGAHLQDHASVPLIYKVPLSDSIEGLIGKPLLALQRLLEYLFTGKGPFGAPITQANFIYSSTHLDHDSHLIPPTPDAPAQIPDTEIMFIPVNSSTQHTFPGLAKSFGAFTYLCAAIQPASAGTLRLTSTDPRIPPACDPAFLADARDYHVLRTAVRLALALAGHLRARGSALEPLHVPADTGDAALDAFIQENADTTYHYSGTCRMAPEREGGVVDDTLCVHGVRGLRVADASVFPRIPTGHLQAPVVMVAERCADFVVRG